MQPTRASNETPLPRAVVRRSAAIAARYAAPEALNPEADPAAPATEPAAAPATPDAPPALPVEPTDPRATDPAYWRQRFNSTAGVLAKERTDRVSTESRLKQQVAELQDANRALEASKPVPETVIDLSEFYSPAEIEQYGEEQCKVMVRSAMRAAAKAVKPQVAEVRPPAAPAEPPARTEQADPAVQAFVQQLTELVPEYQEWDRDPRWLAWLAEDTNGVQRQALLNVHIGNRDAKKVAKMFNDWDRSVAVPAPPITPGGTGAAPSSEAARESPADGLTPPSAAEVKDFYKRAATVRKGQHGYVTDEERVKFEARLALRSAGR